MPINPLGSSGSDFEGYIESWKGFEAAMEALQNMQINSSTQIDIAFASFEFDDAGNLKGLEMSQADLKKLVDYIHSKGGKVKLSFGGATYPLGPSLDKLGSQKLADDIANIVSKLGLDGIDLDIEDGNFDAQKAIDFIHDLRKDMPDKLISLTVPGQAGVPPFSTLIPGVKNDVDTFNFMEYDIWPGDDFVDQIEKDIQQYMSMWGISSKQIHLGLMPGKDDMGHQLSPEDAMKLAKWAKSQNLGGVMIWDLNRDSEDISGQGSMIYTHDIEDILFGNSK